MKKFALLFFLLTIFCCIFAFGILNGRNSGTANDNNELEGKWTSEVQGVTFTFSSDNFSVSSPNPNYWYKGTVELKANSSPKQLKLKIKESGIPQYAGKTSLAIYKIEGDQLTLAANQPGHPTPPPSFEETSGAVVFVLTKQK